MPPAEAMVDWSCDAAILAGEEGSWEAGKVPIWRSSMEPVEMWPGAICVVGR